MRTHSSWRTRIMAGTLSTLVVSGLGLIDSIQSAEALAPTTVTRFAGADRFTTARLTAEEAFPGGTASAVIARADAFPDALAGSYIAGLENAPILLTASNTLHPQASLGLGNLNVSDVFVLGSAAAITETVVDQLEAEGYTVTRIGGANRYETAADVATFGGPGPVGSLGGFGRTAIVASGENFPDALAAGPLSFHDAFPLLLTEPGSLPQGTEDALTSLNIDHVLLAGGPAAVSDGVKSAIEALGITVDRRFGPTRYDTAANLANFARDTLGFATDELILATGSNFPDAVAAGPLGGVEEAPIVLTADPLPAPSAQVCEDNQPTVDELYVMGTTAVVSDPVVETCKGLVEAAPPPPAIETLSGYVWANDPSAVAYTPSAAYSFNSEGGANSITRSGVGSYTVTFGALANSQGHVQVTGYGATSHECHVVSWGPSGADLNVNVRCFTAAGLPVDALYTASFLRPAPGTNGPMGYVWANDADAAAPYNPSSNYSYNSTGALNVVERTGAGQYIVDFPGLDGSIGHAQVTSYGSDPNACAVQSWGTNGPGNARVRVRCYDAAGILTDTRFDLIFIVNRNLHPVGTPSGYVWANDETNAGPYTPSANYRFNSSGASNSIQRFAAGLYTVTLPNVGSAGGTVHVSTYGTGSEQCKVSSWSLSGADALVTVRCFTSAGAAADARFTMSWTA